MALIGLSEKDKAEIKELIRQENEKNTKDIERIFQMLEKIIKIINPAVTPEAAKVLKENK